MRKIADLEKISNKDLLDYAKISAAFKKYLMDVLEYDEGEANYIIATDFEDPYDTPFIMQDYEGKFTIGDRTYEVRSCRTDFCACGLFHLAELPPFEFYMLIDLETLPDTTVHSYQNARKMYLL